MSERIPQSFIDDLLERVDIIEVIGKRLQLRKTGQNFSALCPFHTEKSASFTVSSTKQFYYCFGCGAHGNVISFLMNYDNMEFPDAITSLANSIGVEIPHEITKTEIPGIKLLHSLLEQASDYYRKQLKQSKEAIDYLKSRGLSGEICKRFNVGYAPKGWSNLAHTMPNHHKELLATGMLLQKTSDFYDRFRDRIMFPIRNQRGHVIGFGGRTMGDENPKYLNSPETEIFHKGSELYGLYEAKQTKHKLEKILVVEGYMDVIALAQHGIDYSVATLGTAITPRHIQKLLRHSTNIIFCFDGDTAGRTAAKRSLEQALPLMRDDIQVGFLLLPKGADPDSQIRDEGQDAFRDRITAAIPLSEFLFDQLAAKKNLKAVDDRANLSQEALILLNKIPDGIFKQLMLQKLAQIVHCDVEQLQTLAAKAQKQFTQVADTNEYPSLILKALKILLHNPQLGGDIEQPEQLAKTNLPGSKLLTELIALAKQHKNLTTGSILEHWRDKQEESLLAKLAAENFIISDLKNELLDTIYYIYKQQQELKIQELLKKLNQGEISVPEKDILHKLILDAKLKKKRGEII